MKFAYLFLAMFVSWKASAQIADVKPKEKPRLSLVLEEAMTKAPRIEAAMEQLKALEHARASLLWNTVGVSYGFQKTLGSTTAAGQYYDNSNFTNGGKLGVTLSPAAIFEWIKMGDSILVQKSALVAAQQQIAIELVKVWLDYYFLASSTKVHKIFLKQIDDIIAKVSAGDSPTKKTDLQLLSVQRVKMSRSLLAQIERLNIAHITYRRILQKDPIQVENQPTVPSPSTIDEAFSTLKTGFEKLFRVPSLEEALQKANSNSPQILIAKHRERSGNLANRQARSLWIPNGTIGYGQTYINGVDPKTTTKQWAVGVNWSVGFGKGHEIAAAGNMQNAALLTVEDTVLAVDADIRIIYEKLGNLNTYWNETIELFKSASIGLSEIKDLGADITKTVSLLDSLLEAWAGPMGFNALTSSIILQKTLVHANMGTLFEQVAEIKEYESKEDSKLNHR